MPAFVHPTRRYLLALGKVRVDQGRATAAGKVFELALKLKPLAAPGWVALGGIRLKQGEGDKALAAFETALQVSPGQHARAQQQTHKQKIKHSICVLEDCCTGALFHASVRCSPTCAQLPPANAHTHAGSATRARRTHTTASAHASLARLWRRPRRSWP